MPRGFSETEKREIRHRLIDLAIEAIRDQGFSTTSVSSITEQAGISKGAFYIFFESKEDLFFEALMQEEEKMKTIYRKKSEALLASDEVPNVILEKLLTFILTTINENPIMHVLTNERELSWLFSKIPEEKLEQNLSADDEFFNDIFKKFQDKGIIKQSIELDNVTLLPRLFFIIDYQRGLLAADNHDGFLVFLIRSLVETLSI